MVRRRDFIILTAGAAAVWPLAARAQQAPDRPWRVGWVWNGRSGGNPPQVAGFRQGLKSFGYVEGKTIVVDYRFAEGDSDRVAGLVTDVVRTRPDVLVALGTPVIAAMKQATTDIPIVLLSGDPIGL